MRLGGWSAAAAIVFVLAITGCGDDPGGAGAQDEAGPDAATVAKAEANCRRLRRQVTRLGRQAFSGAPIPTETTARLVRPSLAMLEAFARRQQMLAKESQDPGLQLYARLFEPIIVLAQERVDVGERFAAGDAEAGTLSRGYENLMATVAAEQREVAKRAGLRACAIDFTQVLTDALAG